MLLTLTACTSEENVVYSNMTKPLQLPIVNAGYVEFEIPEELSIVKEDGQSFWVLNDSTTIYLLKNTIPMGTKQDGNCIYNDTNIYYVLPNDCGVITLACAEDKNDYYRKSLNNLKFSEGIFLEDLLCTEDKMLGKLPEYSEVDMVVADNSLYMPIDYTNALLDFNTACYYNEGSQFVESWVMYYRLNDLKPMLFPKVLCNSGGLTAWYEDKDIFYLETDRYVLGAKKITFNQWCCYISTNTPEMRNYLLQGLHKVHFVETEF